MEQNQDKTEAEKALDLLNSINKPHEFRQKIAEYGDTVNE